MIVVAIIGILAAIAVPNYLTMTCRAKQSEVKSNLFRIAHGLEQGVATNGPPTAALTVTVDGCSGLRSAPNTRDPVAFYPLGRSRYRYQYGLITTSPYWFANATGCQEMLGDIWASAASANPWRLDNTVNLCPKER